MGAGGTGQSGGGPFAKWWRDATFAWKAAVGSVLPLSTIAAMALAVVVVARAARYGSREMLDLVSLGAIALAVVGGVGTAVVAITSARGFAKRVGALELDANALALGAELESMPVGSDELDHLGMALRRAGELLAEREAALAAIFAASPDPMMMLGQDGQVLYVSRALSVLCGQDPSEWVGTLVWDHIHPEDSATVAVTVGAVAGEVHARVTVRARLLHARGGWVLVEIHGQGMADAKHSRQGVVVVLRDITERVRLEEGWEQARLAAESANEAKSNFLSRMSHELRTPLNAILGFSQLLQMEGLAPSQSSSVDQIIKAGRHLLALVNEILDISRVEAGNLALEFEAVECYEAVAFVVEMLQAVAAEVNAEVSVESLSSALWVRADRRRLVEILLNLVANAIKYGRPGVRVLVRAYPAEGDWVHIDVIDDGPGIAPERLEEIFLPFERAGAEASTTEGHGLGLPLSQRLAEAMGGTLAVKSLVGKGSVFTLALVRCMAPTEGGISAKASGSRHASEPSGGHGKEGRMDRPSNAEGLSPTEWAECRGTVLYAAANPIAVANVEAALERRPGIRLLVAGRAATAMDLARSHRPDLVVIESHLPDSSGEELAKRLLSASLAAEGSMVVIGGAPGPLGEGEAGHPGLAKPIDPERFVDLVDSAMGCFRRAAP